MHVVLRERIIWDRPGTHRREASALYAEVERLHERTVAPAVEAFLERNYPASTDGVIERLEVELLVPRGKSLADLTPETVEKALFGNRSVAGTGSTTKHRNLRSPDPLVQLVFYLTTGCLPAECLSFPALLNALSADWSDRARAAVLRSDPENRSESLGRLRVLVDRSHSPGNPSHATGDAGKVPGPPPRSAADALSGNDHDSGSASFHREKDFSASQKEVPSAERSSDGQSAPTLRFPQPESSGVLVANAGLVLLHPYLDHLRATAGTETDDSLTAVLLHYAVFGTADCEEWDLPLTKVLLGGKPINHVPPPRLPPTAAQLGIVDALLDGVLDHWAALGSTDRDGLRHNFLQRPGKLEKEPGSWLLTVERRAYDMLLDRLPWAYTTVKTGAMAVPLYVNWT